MKRAVSLELALPERDVGQSVGHWLYDALRTEILEGRLHPGARLPATRDLARQYGLARGTIVNAFDQLASEGYVEGAVGSGTYVSKVLPDKLLQVAARQAEQSARPRQRQPVISDYARRARLFAGYENR